jgi:hypothetical protein
MATKNAAKKKNNVKAPKSKSDKKAKTVTKHKYPRTFKCVINDKNHSVKISRNLRDKHQPYKVENTQDWTNWLNLKRFTNETSANKYFNQVVAKFKKAATKTTKAKGVGSTKTAKKKTITEKVYEVVGRKSGGYSTALKTKYVKASSKNKAKTESGFDYVKAIHLRKDIKPNELLQGLGSTKTAKKKAQKKTLSGSKYHRVSKPVGGVMNSRKQLQTVQLGSMKPAQRFMFPNGKATYVFKGFTKANVAKYESERGGTYESQNLKINVVLI